MYIKEITERLAFLKQELDDLKEMNRRYRSRSKHSPVDRAGIKDELAFMMRRAA